MNAKEHPEGLQVERFLLGETSRAENQRVVRHLLRGCPECQKAASVVWHQTDGQRELESEASQSARWTLSRPAPRR